MELIGEVYNVLNLLNSEGGLIRETGTLLGASTEDVALLRLCASDAAHGRNAYDVTLPGREVVNTEASDTRQVAVAGALAL